ncbi:hypothetical protein ACOMHN_012128 [Nucella lapillus]
MAGRVVTRWAVVVVVVVVTVCLDPVTTAQRRRSRYRTRNRNALQNDGPRGGKFISSPGRHQPRAGLGLVGRLGVHIHIRAALLGLLIYIREALLGLLIYIRAALLVCSSTSGQR